jgi:hypothetical protein
MMMDRQKNWEQNIKRGAKLIEHLVENEGNRFSKITLLEPFKPPDTFSIEAENLLKDYSAFLEDVKETETKVIFLPTKDSLAVKTTACVFRKPPKCTLHKYWVRETIKPGVLVVPFSNQEGKITRTIISVDPHSEYVLPCLGFELEKAETEERMKIGLRRSGKPRYEKEYSDNDDPWYDGRGHNFTIIDSPRCGSVLRFDEVIRIMCSLYEENRQFDPKVKSLDAFISYRRDGGSDIAWSIKTQLESKGKSVFLDMASLKGGLFDEQLLKNLQKAKNVVLILSRGALDRCRNENDWVRREMHEALTLHKNIIPVRKDDFVFPTDETLPQELQGLFRHNAITLSHEYFYAAVEKIVTFMQ